MSRPLPVVRRLLEHGARSLRRAGAAASVPREGGFWVSLRIDEELGELPLPLRRHDAPTHLLEALLVLEACGHDPRVDGVLLHLSGGPSGWSAAQSLRRTLWELRERGVPVVAFAEQLDATSYLVASAAQEIWMPETGRLFLVGIRAEGFYLKGLLEHVHVEPEVVRIGSHKAAGEMFTRESMSPEQREQTAALVDDLYDALVHAIAEGRGLAPGRVREQIDAGPYMAGAAAESGLLDACCYADEIPLRLGALGPVRGAVGRQRAILVDARTFRDLHASAPTVWREPPTLAWVVAQGAISHGSGSRGVASEPFASLFDDLRRSAAVRGVGLRIDSPGGDALASDLLWRAVERLREEKAVVVSMGEVAASGGYYLASAADRLFAEAGSVTGSIGVVGGKLNLEGLYRRIGVGRDAVERGARAGLLSEARGFTPDERRVVRREMETLYAAFLDRVARGRGLAVDAVHGVAEGRVWSGERALRLGLVDALGGPLEALRELRRRAGLAPGEPFAISLLPRAPRLAGLRALLDWLR
jgi:protease IV